MKKRVVEVDLETFEEYATEIRKAVTSFGELKDAEVHAMCLALFHVGAIVAVTATLGDHRQYDEDYRARFYKTMQSFSSKALSSVFEHVAKEVARDYDPEQFDAGMN